MSRGIKGFVTRYPITQFGSINVCATYLRSTVNVGVLYELDDNWERKEIPAPEFPVINDKTFDSMSLPANRLAAMGA